MLPGIWICEQQRYVRAAFQNGNRFVRIRRFDRRPGVGDDVRRTHTQRLIVFHHQDRS